VAKGTFGLILGRLNVAVVQTCPLGGREEDATDATGQLKRRFNANQHERINLML